MGVRDVQDVSRGICVACLYRGVADLARCCSVGTRVGAHRYSVRYVPRVLVQDLQIRAVETGEYRTAGLTGRTLSRPSLEEIRKVVGAEVRSSALFRILEEHDTVGVKEVRV